MPIVVQIKVQIGLRRNIVSIIMLVFEIRQKIQHIADIGEGGGVTYALIIDRSFSCVFVYDFIFLAL